MEMARVIIGPRDLERTIFAQGTDYETARAGRFCDRAGMLNGTESSAGPSPNQARSCHFVYFFSVLWLSFRTQRVHKGLDTPCILV